MKTIEFETTIRDGLIQVPSHYKNMENTHAKVIVLVVENPEEVNYDKDLVLKMFGQASRTGLFNEIIDSVSWQKLQRNDWE